MNTELPSNSRVYLTTHNSVNFNSSGNVTANNLPATENKNLYTVNKRNLCLSPTLTDKNIADNIILNVKLPQSRQTFGSNISMSNITNLYNQQVTKNLPNSNHKISSVIQTQSQNQNQKMETPRKSKIIKQPMQIKEEYSHNKSRMKSYFGQTRDIMENQALPQTTKKIDNLKNLFMNPFSNGKASSNTANTTNKINARNGVVKSLDFQTLKKFKK